MLDIRGHTLPAAFRSPIVLLAIGIIPLAFLLRATPLGHASYCLDEVTSVAIARLDWPKFVALLSHREANMTAYYLLLRAWSSLGVSETIVRTLSLILALATLPVLYAFAARWFGQRVGLVSALLLAVNALHILYGQIARSYSLVVFLVTLSALLFVRGIEQPSRRVWAGYALTTTLALYSHFFAFFVLIAQWVSLAFVRDRKIPWRPLVAAISVVALLTGPLGAFVVISDAKQIAWIARPDARDILRVFTTLVGGGVVRLLIYIAACVLAFGYRADIRFLADRREITARVGMFSTATLRDWRYWFLLTWLFVPIVLAFVVSIVKPVWVPNYFIVCLPPLMILVARGISRIRPAAVFGSVLAVLVVFAIYGDVFRARHRGEDWMRATAEVLAEGRPDDALLFYHPYVRQAFEMYHEKLHRSTNAPEVVFPASWDPSIHEVDVEQRPSSALLKTLSARYSRVWLVTGSDNIPQLGRDAVSRSIQASLASKYHFRRVDQFSGGITVQLYSKRALPPTSATHVDAPVMLECP